MKARERFRASDALKLRDKDAGDTPLRDDHAAGGVKTRERELTAELVERIKTDDAIKGAVITSGKASGFCAGADLGDMASVAHFTRLGNSCTPESGVSRSMSSARAASQCGQWPVMASSRNASPICRACAWLLPRTVSVMSDALAIEMAQPRPWKPASAMDPSSPSASQRSILSPQSGLSPRA